MGQRGSLLTVAVAKLFYLEQKKEQVYCSHEVQSHIYFIQKCG